jgi:hypothetical protein
VANAGRRKAVWVSTSNDLIHDARRDLNELGATDVPVFGLGASIPVISVQLFHHQLCPKTSFESKQ